MTSPFPFHPGKIFVFGSNLAGIHGAGAAREALDRYGAKSGVGWGPHGQSYAIPTKDFNIQTLSLDYIRAHVDMFLHFARTRQGLKFFLTPIGTGLAGYSHSDIAPLFKGIPHTNCGVPQEWKEWL